MIEEDFALGVDHADGAFAGGLEGLVVRAVFLGGLSHEADVGDSAHRLGVEGAVLFAEVDRGGVDAGVAAVGDNAEGVLALAGGIPHLAGGADHRGHRGVDDHVRRDVKIGDALVGVDHRDGGAGGEAGGDGGLDGGFLVGGEFLDFAEEVAEAVVQIDAEGGEGGGVFREEVFEEDADGEAEHDGVGDLHHRGLEVEGEEGAVRLGLDELLGEEGAEGLPVHEGGVEDFAGFERGLFLEDDGGGLGAIRGDGGDELDADGGGGGDGDRLLVGEEIIMAHGADGSLGGGGPCAHGVRMGAGVGLDGFGGAAVGVALAEDGIYRGAHDFSVAGFGVFLCVGGGDLGEIGERIAFGLKLGDGGLELGDGGGDVGQLDDVGLGLERESAEFGESVGHALGGREQIREGGEDAGGDGDVAGLDVDAGVFGEGLHDRQEGISGEGRGLVGDRVDDGGIGGHVGKNEKTERVNGQQTCARLDGQKQILRGLCGKLL